MPNFPNMFHDEMDGISHFSACLSKIDEMDAESRVHDPYVEHWWEFEGQESYPENSKSVFFRNQKKLKDLRVQQDLAQALKGAEVMVFAVRHEPYLNLDPDEVVRLAGQWSGIMFLSSITVV